MVNEGPRLAGDRVEVIDAMRGIAILGILFFNMPFAANTAWLVFHDVRAIGWSPADEWTYRLLEVSGEGTMRGMLQLLFGAGLMLFARKAMTPDSPVIYADLWMRRNFWLAAFGLVNVFALLWPGDILFSYAVAALFLFPFRNLSPRALLGFALIYLLAKMGLALQDYLAAIEPPQAGGDGPPEMLRRYDEFLGLREGGLIGGIAASARTWGYIWSDGVMRDWVIEAFFTMMVGMALLKLGWLQGARSRQFYGWAALLLYAAGLGIRWVIVDQSVAGEPPLAAILAKPARLMVALAHIAFVLWLWKGRARRLLDPFVPAGRMAFTLYLTQSLVLSHFVFAPYGLDLFRRFGWFECALLSLAIIVVQVILAGWWLKRYRFGPLEWIWRSLTYWQRQPMAAPAPIAL